MALTAAPAEQELLLGLHDLDTRLQQLAHRARTLPEAAELARLVNAREQAHRELVDARGALEDAQAELGRVEADVKVVETRIARDSERLQSSSSVKDIQGLEHELASLRARLDTLEDIELAVMETVETRQSEFDSAERLEQELDESIVSATESRDDAATEIEAQRASTAADRAVLAARIPGELLALYEKQRERYGVGASLLRFGVSSASGVALGASDLARVRSAAPDAVLLCPDSSAILVRTAESGL